MALRLAIIDGTFRYRHEAFIPVDDPGLLRGDGVFEVARVYRGRPFALEDHFDRLARSADGLGQIIDLDEIRRDVDAVLAHGDTGDAVIRIIATRGGRRLVLLEDVPSFPDTIALTPVVYEQPDLLVGLKTLSYAANELATRRARQLGADQALLVSRDGRVLEGPNFAVFAVLDDPQVLVTPPLTDGVLDSITRRRLLEVVRAVECSMSIERLRSAREIFVASTVREVLPVHRLDDVPFPAPGPCTRAARTAFRALVDEHAQGPDSTPAVTAFDGNHES